MGEQPVSIQTNGIFFRVVSNEDGKSDTYTMNVESASFFAAIVFLEINVGDV